MPSPFPGMDPYLEGDLWIEFHQSLAHQIKGQANARLPRRYVALFSTRHVFERPSLEVYGEAPERTVYPDVQVLEPPPTPRAEEGVSFYAKGPAVELASPIPEDYDQLSVEIRDIEQRRLVTLIEILSPANKEGDGAGEYHRRRLDILRTRTHLIEVDLLRRGRRVELVGKPPPSPYYAYLSRIENRPKTQVWPIGLSERLPSVPLPLLPRDDDIALDLQAAIDACRAGVRYEELLPYRRPAPPPPLNDADAAWIRERLRVAGFAAD